MKIVPQYSPREFNAIFNDSGTVLCDNATGAFLVLRFAEDLERLKALLASLEIKSASTMPVTPSNGPITGHVSPIWRLREQSPGGNNFTSEEIVLLKKGLQECLPYFEDDAHTILNNWQSTTAGCKKARENLIRAKEYREVLKRGV